MEELKNVNQRWKDEISKRKHDQGFLIALFDVIMKSFLQKFSAIWIGFRSDGSLKKNVRIGSSLDKSSYM